jgi:hypothetical protein
MHYKHFLPVRRHRHLLGGSDFNQNLSRSTGAVFNSNTELLFSGVSLRSGFSFSFDLVPRSKKESDEIKDIIRFFKSESAAQKGAAGGDAAGLFLKSPSVFRLRYMSGGKPHPFLNQFKICALNAMSVNYTASGTYATYSDATPVHMQMTLTFQELTPIYREDYIEAGSPTVIISRQLKEQDSKKMSYFRELPNLEYQSFLSSRKGSDEYLLVKNIFRRVKLRDDLQNVFTIFNKYEIQEGARPDTVAEELYGSSQYDWVVLIGAGIINVRNEWPLSDRDIYRYSEQLYGNDINAVHHYETTEVKDSRGRLNTSGR